MRPLMALACAAAGALLAVAILRATISSPSHEGGFPVASGGSVGSQPLERKVEELTERLEAAAAVQASLRARLDALEGRLGDVALAPAESDRPEPPDGPTGSRSESSRERLDADRLVAAGFSPREVASFSERIDEVELRRLQLRDRATREGWLETPRYASESRALSDELEGARQEFGEDFYDWYLYATGRPNRVRVERVLAGSPAAEAGIRQGDVVERYADVRVLTPRELSRLTTEGSPRSSTRVDLLRDGERLRVYVPRGPLGVTLEAALVEPEPIR